MFVWRFFNMSILKKMCAVMLSGSLFLCGSGFSNKYEDVQTIELKSNAEWNWVVQIEECDEYLESELEQGEVEITRTFKCDSNNDSICSEATTTIFSVTGKKEGIVALGFVLVKHDLCVDDEKAVVAILRVNEKKQIKMIGFWDFDELALASNKKLFLN